MAELGFAEKSGAGYLGGAVEKVLFAVLHSMVTGNDVNNILSHIVMFAEDIQLIAFALHPDFYTRMPTWAQYVANPLSYRPHAYSQYIVLFGIVIGITSLAIVSAAKVAVSFESGKFAGLSLLALKTLRLVTMLIGTVLFMPFLEILFVAVSCFGENSTLIEYPDVQCFNGPYSAQTVIAIIMLLIFVPYNVIMASIYMETSPHRSSRMARVPIGRFDTIYTCFRIILAAVFSLARDARVRIGVLLPVTVILSYLITRYQPFYLSYLNQMRAGIFFAASAAALLALVSYVADSDGIGYPIATVVSVPLGAAVGVVTSRKTLERTINGVYARLQLKRKTVSSSLRKIAQGDKTIKTYMLSDDLEKGSIGGDNFIGEEVFKDLKTITKTRTRAKNIRVFNHEVEVELACRFLHNNRSPEALFIMDEIFGEGFSQYPKNAMLCLCYADYLEAYTDVESGRSEAAFFIQQAKSFKPPFDARFFIFMQDRILEQSKKTEGLNSSTLNISSYVEFQTMQNGARQYHLAALLELRAFLNHIRAGQRGRDPKTYPIFLQRISEAEQRATEYYKKLVARWPKSKVILRMYSAFLMQIKNDKESAAKYMSVADEIEEIESRINTNPSAFPQRAGSAQGSISRRRASMGSLSSQSAFNSLGRKGGNRGSTVAMPPNISVVMEEARVSDLENISDDDVVQVASGPGPVPGSALRHRTSIAKFEEDEDEEQEEDDDKPEASYPRVSGINFEEKVDYAPDSGVRFDRGATAPSESNPSTRSSEREARQKTYFKTQLHSRLKAPVNALAIKQKIATGLFIGITIATFAVGIYSFKSAGKTISGFSRATRMSTAATKVSQDIRFMTQAAFSTPDDEAALRKYFAWSASRMKSSFQNSTIYYSPYLANFYHDPASAQLVVSNYPDPVKSIKYMNAYQATKLMNQYMQDFVQKDWDYYTVNRLNETSVRFILDNSLRIQEMYESATLIGMKSWIAATMGNIYVLYGLLGALCVTLLAWEIFLFAPMINQTHEEQVRTLKMYAMLPKKPLMHMLTDVEEQIETIADEMSATREGQDNGGDEDGEKRAAAMAASQMLNRTVDVDRIVKKSPTKKHTFSYLLGLFLLLLPAVALVAVPIIRALSSTALASTMNYTNGRRYLAEGVVLLGFEAIFKDSTTWKPWEALMWYQDRLQSLANLHQDAVSGRNCIATPTISQLREITLESATCQPACGNMTMGVDGQIEWFLSAATQFFANAQAEKVGLDDPSLNLMYTLVPSITDNLNKMDKIFQDIIILGNATGQTAMMILFIVTVIGTAAIYLFILRRTVAKRLEEMESAVTLIFGIPEQVVQTIPEIKRFIESGGMFADDVGIGKKRK